jgi:hypothetical protein
MNLVLGACAAVIAVVAAARSTWSPCGVSMLATITPLAERGRGHRYRSTAAWFVTGAVAGGATLGLCLLAVAASLRAAGISAGVSVAVGCTASVLAAAADTGIGGFRLPVHHRQVNERWLDGFRPWVYGAGFGWQIGTGVATYIKTAAVYLLIVLAALSASPLLALGLGVLFGLVRGLAVFLGRGITSPAALAEFHRRFIAFGPLARAGAVACELAVGVALAAARSPWAAVALIAVVALVGAAAALRRRVATT